MEQQTISRRIQLNNTIPDTVGFLDGTRICLSLGPGGDSDYINRKSFSSMQLHVKCLTLLTYIVFLFKKINILHDIDKRSDFGAY